MKISFNWGKKTISNPLGVVLEECLAKEEAGKIKQLDIEKVLLLGTEERIKLFSSAIGDKAEWFNSKFEKDYVLKNMKQGLLNWVDKTEMKEKYRKDILSRIAKLENMLSAEEQEKFIEKLANLAIGVGTTEEEEQTITDLCNRANEAHLRMQNGGSREDYEKAQSALDTYVE